MNDDTITYCLELSEIIMGEVAGKLTVVGAWIEGMENDNGTVKIEAKIPKNNIKQFKEWFSDVSDGKGVMNEKA